MADAYSLRAGDQVELRSPGEVLATLDEHACLDGVPFMPEMLAFFGKPFTVRAQVRRACDTVSYTGVRRLDATVILDELRCDGSGHAGCGAQCRIYWKEAWLRPVGSGTDTSDLAIEEALVRLAERAAVGARAATSTSEAPIFRCQATELLRASAPVSWYDLGSLVGELRSGNVGPFRWVRAMIRIVVEEIGLRLGKARTTPFAPEELADQRSAPSASRTLAPGQLVQIRTKDEIRQTLAENGKHRGLWFDREMVPYCGRTTRVRAKVERFIDEADGRLVELGSDCYILDDVVCQSYHSDKRWFCPRAIYPWWREAWLEPVADAESPTGN